MKHTQTTLCEVSPSPLATKRTKNRITRLTSRQSLMWVIRFGNPDCFNGTRAVLVQEIGIGKWKGWFPVHEVIIEKDGKRLLTD